MYEIVHPKPTIVYSTECWSREEYNLLRDYLDKWHPDTTHTLVVNPSGFVGSKASEYLYNVEKDLPDVLIEAWKSGVYSLHILLEEPDDTTE